MKNAILILPQNLTLNTMVSFIILLIARTARIACPDRQTERQNDRQNDKPSTVTLAAHARRGLMKSAGRVIDNACGGKKEENRGHIYSSL